MRNSDGHRRRALVTGGAGFIGASTVRALLHHGHEVTVLDDWSTGRSDYLKGLDVNLVTADILDRAAVDNAVEGHQVVVHLAAQTGVPGSVENPYKDCETNVVGTLNVLVAARNHAVSRFVFASSNAPLGRQQPPATEDMAPLPISPYGASKLAGEAYCLAF
ncbi:MAG: NAD-dependent epimerase/dehydratase family protein, partial [Actinomycetota bacterium]